MLFTEKFLIPYLVSALQSSTGKFVNIGTRSHAVYVYKDFCFQDSGKPGLGVVKQIRDCLNNEPCIYGIFFTFPTAFQILTKDSVTVNVDGVVYYRVQNATQAVANVTNADSATRLLAQTTLRNVLGTKSLSEILSDREEIARSMQVGASWSNPSHSR